MATTPLNLLANLRTAEAEEPVYSNLTPFACGHPGYVGFSEDFINTGQLTSFAIFVDGSGINICFNGPGLECGETIAWLPFNSNSPVEDGKPVLTELQAKAMAQQVDLEELARLLFSDSTYGGDPQPTPSLAALGFERII